MSEFNEMPGPIAAPTEDACGPFRVEVDEGACEHCGKGATWVVVDSDGDALLGQIWRSDEDGQCPSEAMEVCEAMNWAYNLGAKQVHVQSTALPEHLQHDAPPAAQCNVCGRKSWYRGDLGLRCNMTQPDRTKCPGEFHEIGRGVKP